MSDICENCWDEIGESDDYNVITLKKVELERLDGFRILDQHGVPKIKENVLVEFKLCDDCADKLLEGFERHDEGNHTTKEDIRWAKSYVKKGWTPKSTSIGRWTRPRNHTSSCSRTWTSS